MNQHPVPQNVTQYQFRLVGDMTLKQFLELAAGLIFALLFYSSNLLFIFKAPLILLSVFLGIALAFFPIEDRPLDQWFVNFIKSIYRPTRFTWQKTNKVPSIFSFAPHAISPTNTITKTIKAPTQKVGVAQVSDLSESENSQIKALNSLFSALPNPPVVAPSSGTTNTGIIYAKPVVTVRKLKPQGATVTPPIAPSKKVVTTPESDPSPVTIPPTQSSTQSQGSIPTNLIFAAPAVQTAKTELSAANTKMRNISLPVPPRSPNLIVGVTTTKEGKLVEGAIVQVLDQTGLPARAMKTNALGQFATSTPLAPGTYRIEVESDGHTFDAQQLVVNNTIISPFEIRATG